MSIAEYYDPESRWGRDFGYRSPIYTLGYHRGQDLRKTDPTGRYSVVTDIVSLSDGVVHAIYVERQTGGEIVVDTGRKRGRYEIHCHSVAFAGVGAKVKAGATGLGRNATWGEDHGTSWDAPHDHFVISDYADAGHNTNRQVYDPRPFIRDALAAAAAADVKPFPIDQEEDEMAIYTKPSDGGTVYEIRNGRKRGLTAAEWTVVQAAYAAIGEKVPYARNTLTQARLNDIPNG